MMLKVQKTLSRIVSAEAEAMVRQYGQTPTGCDHSYMSRSSKPGHATHQGHTLIFGISMSIPEANSVEFTLVSKTIVDLPSSPRLLASTNIQKSWILRNLRGVWYLDAYLRERRWRVEMGLRHSLQLVSGTRNKLSG
jgi:hypothetical protein